MSVVTRAATIEEPSMAKATIGITYFRMAVILAVLAAFAMYLDAPINRFFRAQTVNGRHVLPGDLHRFISLHEFFGHGACAGMMILAVYVLDRARRNRVMELMVCTFGAGLLANVVKFSVGRTRPLRFDGIQPITDTFVVFFPSLFAKSENLSKGWEIQSFPSGHTTIAVALAIGFTRLYPHGRWLFASFATIVAIQRLDAGAHWLSDTLAGAALAFLWAGMVEWYTTREKSKTERISTVAG